MGDEILRTYGDVTIKQDVVALIEILTAREVWFYNNLSPSTAYATVHQTQVDTLPTADSLAVEEGTDLTAAAVSTPSLLTNLVQHIARPFKVSYVQQKVAHFSGENELNRQLTKALMEFANGAEVDIVRSTLVSGQSGSKPKMRGIVQAVSKSTNSTAHSSGTVLSASIINGLMKDNWDNGNGNTATDLFMGSFLRNVVDGFTQKTNQLVQVPVNTIDNTIDVYQTSFGRINVHVHRYVQSSLSTSGTLGSDSTGRLLAVRPEYLKIAYLTTPYTMDLAKTGPADFKAVLADFTLEVRNQNPHWSATGFDKD